MCGVIALIFIATTAAEVVLLVKVGSVIGALATFGVIVATGCLGAFLAKRAGVAALARLRSSVHEGGTNLALVEGALVLAAGVTLLSPGFITDAVGLLLLIAPIRAIVAVFVWNRLKGRMGDVIQVANFGPLGSDEDPPPPGVIDV